MILSAAVAGNTHLYQQKHPIVSQRFIGPHREDQDRGGGPPYGMKSRGLGVGRKAYAVELLEADIPRQPLGRVTAS